MTPAKASLTLFFAQARDRAVILRRGPSRQFRMIGWQRKRDRFEDGQWLKHRVVLWMCDLSPDGAHFLYTAVDSRNGRVFVGLSRVPYFTPLAFHPVADTWGPGPRFLDNRRYVTRCDAPGHGPPRGFRRLEPVRLDGGWGARHADGRMEPAVDLAERWPVPQHPRYHTEGGKLLRERGGKLVLIRDFTDMRFAPIRAPYAPGGQA